MQKLVFHTALNREPRGDSLPPVHSDIGNSLEVYRVTEPLHEWLRRNREHLTSPDIRVLQQLPRKDGNVHQHSQRPVSSSQARPTCSLRRVVGIIIGL